MPMKKQKSHYRDKKAINPGTLTLFCVLFEFFLQSLFKMAEEELETIDEGNCYNVLFCMMF